jgi:hypothetical protein
VNITSAIENVILRVKEQGYGSFFKLIEIEQWLGVIIKNDGKNHHSENETERYRGFDFIWLIEQINAQLVLEHSIYLEANPDREGFVAILPNKKRYKMVKDQLSREKKITGRIN